MPQVGDAGPQGYYRSQDDYRPQGYYPPQDDYRSQADYQAQDDYQSGWGGSADRGQVPWDGALPEPDPALRYREPGPGMPGYRGSRDARYGGDRR
jgi:hypothetical protein